GPPSSGTSGPPRRSRPSWWRCPWRSPSSSGRGSSAESTMRRDWPAILLCLPFLGPVAFLVLASLTPSREFGQGRYWSFPPTLENFSLAWQSPTFILYYRHPILYTVRLPAVPLVAVAQAAYA